MVNLFVNFVLQATNAQGLGTRLINGYLKTEERLNEHQQFNYIELLMCLTETHTHCPIRGVVINCLHQEVSLICYIMVCNTGTSCTSR